MIKDPMQLSPLTLAYLGDTVYELLNRSYEIEDSDKSVEKLHKHCSMRAKAVTQARMAQYLKEYFTEEEAAVFRRGRNATVYTKAKNATIREYHDATGLEAVVGYLYLLKREDRIRELLFKAWEEVGVL